MERSALTVVNAEEIILGKKNCKWHLQSNQVPGMKGGLYRLRPKLDLPQKESPEGFQPVILSQSEISGLDIQIDRKLSAARDVDHSTPIQT